MGFRNYWMMRAAGPLMIALAAVSAFAAQSSAAPKGELPFGIYDPDGDFSDDPEITVEHLFLPWEDVYLPSLVEADSYALERGRSVLVTIEPWTWSRSERNTAERLQQGISTGEYDRYMSSICAVLNLFESPVTVRWAQEMEDESGQFIWAAWEPDAYIAAYRHMVDICRAQAPKINYMWSPSGYDDLADYYPGDDYVDLVGLSVFGYQPWERDILGKELSFKEILAPRYALADQFGKPIVVAELGYAGDQAYVDKWDSEVRKKYAEFPNLAAVVYFNQVEVYPWPNGYGRPNWKLDAHVIGK
jgi:endoglucanase